MKQTHTENDDGVKYRAIVADPPWAFRNVKTGGSMTSGAAQHYPTMSVDDIMAMPVRAIADPNSVLFLWYPTSFNTEALDVARAWGYRHVTTLYWVKSGRKLGLGFWFRNKVEPCLFCTRGKVRAFRSSHKNVIVARATTHSKKPSAFWRTINPILDEHNLSPRIELFCRGKPRRGWDGYGNECVDGVDIYDI